MDQNEIKKLLTSFQTKEDRTIAIVDYGNIEKWKESLGWIIGIKELSQLVKNFSRGNKELRRFYYGSDYGEKESCVIISMWSNAILEKAKMNRFEVITKRVEYIHDKKNKFGYDKKCNFDVEMSVDLIKLKDFYDNIVLFSGDGDLMYVVEYLHSEYQKKCLVFGARGHIGREIFDAQNNGCVEGILFVEDFEYRLNKGRFLK